MKQNRNSFTIKNIPISERPREKIISSGSFFLSDKELLAAILGRGIQGESVLITAERLLARFKTINKIIQASPQELMTIKGIGVAKATQLKAVLEAGRRTFKKEHRRIKVQPFLKWAGGKSQLLEQYAPLFLQKYNIYLEPFLGGGAVFFYLEPKKAILSDSNKDLIDCLLVVRDKVEELIKQLKIYKTNYSREHFEEIKRKYNANVLNRIERAAAFIYLNKTCFNGLYRVNSKGEFNVPFGRYKNPAIFDEENLKAASKLFKKTNLFAGDFSEVLKYARKNDFVYLDPPYHPLSKTSCFTSYTNEVFLEKEQGRLRDVFKELDKRGCKVMLSNSDTPFIHNLYKRYRIEKVYATRAINVKGEGRGKITELVILNY